VAPAELAAVGFGLAYILLAIREHRACWIAGGISTSIYAGVFLEAGLPMQAALQVVYVAMSVWGYFAWRRDAAAAVPVRRWRLPRHLLALAGVGLATAISAPLAARYALAAAPIADSLGTWASLVATWLLARRIIDTWYWWILVDTGLSALFASQGLRFTAVLYLAYALLAIAGWRSWRRAMEPPP
jgi:nicotinamide mononucleotide transporter